MKALGYTSLGMTFVNSFNMFVNTGQYATSVYTGAADATYVMFVMLLIIVLGTTYYFATSKAGKI